MLKLSCKGKKSKWIVAFAMVMAAGLGSVPAAQAQTSGNTFHLGTECTDFTVCTHVSFGGTQIHITENTLPTFGIRRSPDTNSGLSDPQLFLVVMVPSQLAQISFTGNFNGTAAAANLYSTTPWTSGFLITADSSGYLGSGGMLGTNFIQNMGDGSSGPASPLDAFLTGASTVQPGTTGFLVYVLSFGSVDFPTSDTFSFTGIIGFPVGSIFYAFVTDGSGDFQGLVSDTTAPSSAILIVPEPGSMLLLGSGLLTIGSLLRRRLHGASTRRR